MSGAAPAPWVPAPRPTAFGDVNLGAFLSHDGAHDDARARALFSDSDSDSDADERLANLGLALPSQVLLRGSAATRMRS